MCSIETTYSTGRPIVEVLNEHRNAGLIRAFGGSTGATA
jgi:hypothetical protein